MRVRDRHKAFLGALDHYVFPNPEGASVIAVDSLNRPEAERKNFEINFSLTAKNSVQH